MTLSKRLFCSFKKLAKETLQTLNLLTSSFQAPIKVKVKLRFTFYKPNIDTLKLINQPETPVLRHLTRVKTWCKNFISIRLRVKS